MDHRGAFVRESGRMREMLAEADPDAAVPTCPDWTVADLAHHVASVLNRFAQIVDGRLTTNDEVKEVESLRRPAGEVDWATWLGDRADQMADLLGRLRDDEPVWTFTRATDNVGAWVARRMHHEVLVHRVDLERAIGAEHLGIAADEATDGIDELVTDLSSTGPRLDEADQPCRLRVVADRNGYGPPVAWTVELAPGERPSGSVAPPNVKDPADVCLRGAAPALLLAVWRRDPVEPVLVDGDVEVARRVLEAVGR